MKKNSLILLLILFYSWATSAAILRVTPLDKKTITNGDMISVQLSVDEDISWNELLLQNVGEIFYVLKVEGQAQGVADAKVLVVQPKSPEYNGIMKIKDKEFKVEVSGFESNWIKESPLQEYLKVVTEHDYKQKDITWIVITLLIACFLGIIFRRKFKKIITRKAKLRRIKQEQITVMNKITSAKTRKDLENIYQLKSEIKKLYTFDIGSFNRFERQMNLIQYKPEWTEDELILAKQSLQNLQNDLKEKRGV